MMDSCFRVLSQKDMKGDISQSTDVKFCLIYNGNLQLIKKIVHKCKFRFRIGTS